MKEYKSLLKLIHSYIKVCLFDNKFKKFISLFSIKSNKELFIFVLLLSSNIKI